MNLGDQQRGVVVVLIPADRLRIGLVGIGKAERAVDGRADLVVILRRLASATKLSADMVIKLVPVLVAQAEEGGIAFLFGGIEGLTDHPTELADRCLV